MTDSIYKKIKDALDLAIMANVGVTFTPPDAFALLVIMESLEKLRSELAALREQVRWIPVSEKLPKDNQEVLIYADLIAKGVHSTKSRQWSADGYYYHGDWYDTVTHWMPLPLPPEEK